MKNSVKKTIKKLVPEVIIKNGLGLKDSFSYYPSYVIGRGAVKRLKSVTIEVTMKCNCRCLMCPLYGVQTGGGKKVIDSIKRNKELTTQEFSGLFHELRMVGVESLTFSGGEPFLRKNILDLIRMAKENRFILSITSNGGVITEEAAKKIVEYGLDSLTLSLDGPKGIHERIRKARIFEKIMHVVDIIKAEKAHLKKSKPNISFLCTVSALNQSHLVDLVNVCKEKEIPLTIDPIIFTDEEVIEATKSHFTGDQFSKQESFIMPEEIGGVDIRALKKELRKVRSLAKEIDQPVFISIEKDKELERFFEEQDYSVVNKCFVPWYSLRIDTYGNVYPCSISVSMGNVRKNKIEDIINDEKYVNFRNKLKEKGLLPFCTKCCALYDPQNIVLPKDLSLYICS